MVHPLGRLYFAAAGAISRGSDAERVSGENGGIEPPRSGGGYSDASSGVVAKTYKKVMM